MFEKIFQPETFKNIITLIIIPLSIAIYNNMPIKSRKKLKWDPSNEGKKIWSNYFPPLVTMIILELSFMQVSQKIKCRCLHILIYIIITILLFSFEFWISTFWYLSFKNKNEYLSKKHLIHLIFAIDSILLCFAVETYSKFAIYAYILIAGAACILHVCFMVKCNTNSYKKLKYIKIEFEDNTVEKNIIKYEQNKKSIILFINSSQEIIKKTFYEAKIKKKIEIYY